MEGSLGDLMNIKEIITPICESIIQSKEQLNSLDAAIGDGDHGTNMARGSQAILDKIDSLSALSYGDALNQMAMILISSVGGASGPLYGTALMKFGMVLKKSDTFDPDTFKEALNSAIEGIKMRGRSDYGCKTMLDVLIPASELFASNYTGDNLIPVLKDMSNEGVRGVEYTVGIKATKGRASYLGERSIGTADPGATSSSIILTSLYNTFESARED